MYWGRAHLYLLTFPALFGMFRAYRRKNLDGLGLAPQPQFFEPPGSDPAAGSGEPESATWAPYADSSNEYVFAIFLRLSL